MENLVGSSNMEFFGELFRTLDKDNSGHLDKKELELALEHCSDRPDQVDFYMHLVDDDSSGTVDMNEFMFLMIISQEKYTAVKKSVEAFEKYNTNATDKMIDKTELKAALKDLQLEVPEEQFNEFFDTLDVDKSGKLNMVEFHMMSIAIKQNAQE